MYVKISYRGRGKQSNHTRDNFFQFSRWSYRLPERILDRGTRLDGWMMDG